MTQTAIELQNTNSGAQALAAQSVAMIQARTVMAMQRPRDIDEFRTRLLAECKRPGFAQIAMYCKPAGRDNITGMSVRFAEAALRHLKNFDVREETIAESIEQVTIRVTATDLETNVSTSTDVRVGKTVERRQRKDREVIGERTNSNGDTVYILAATEDEMMVKSGAALAKARRNLIMRLIPGDIVDDCKVQIADTVDSRDKSDPEAARKKLYDAFASLGVGPVKLKAYLGHENTPNKAEMTELRGIYTAIQTGETTWAEVWEAKFPDERTSVRDALGKASGKVTLPDSKSAPAHDPETGEVSP